MEQRINKVRPHQLVDQLLEHPELIKTVQALKPEALGKLIRHVGLEDCGAIVEWATTDQIAAVFDEDLWVSDRPGEEEAFDADRFATWLEVLLEAGEGFAAERVSEMDEELLILALCRHVLVINQDELAAGMSSSDRSDEDDLLDKELDSCLYIDLDEYQIISRNHRSWDPFMSILVELQSKHHDLFCRLLERCCNISHDYIEENGGLYDVLTSEEMLETDVAADREERREKKGYVPPASAASFLQLARVTPLSDIWAASAQDPVTRAHFRAVEPVAVRSVVPERVSSSIKALAEAVENLEGDSSGSDAIEKEDSGAAPGGELALTVAMKKLRDEDPVLYGERSVELAFLVNVLMAGCSFRGRRFRAAEALEGALATANLGGDAFIRAGKKRVKRVSAVEMRRVLSEVSLVKLFRAGWSILYRDVVMYSGEQFRNALERRDAGQRSGGARPALAELTRRINEGKPWLAMGKIEDFCHIVGDGKLLQALSLLEECPTLPAAELRGEDSERGPFIASEARVQAARHVLGFATEGQTSKRSKRQSAPEPS